VLGLVFGTMERETPSEILLGPSSLGRQEKKVVHGWGTKEVKRGFGDLVDRMPRPIKSISIGLGGPC